MQGVWKTVRDRGRKTYLGPVFYISLALAVCFIVWGLTFRHSLSTAAASVLDIAVGTFGWVYVVVVFIVLIFVAGLAFSRFGKIRLGDPDQRPQFGSLSWIAMLFSAGVGMSFLYWGTAEPLIHFAHPPHGAAAAESTQSGVMSLQYSYLFWGLHAWAIYGLVAIAVGYSSYRTGRPVLISSALHPLLGDRVNGPIGKAVDVLTVLAILFGIATSTGLGTLNLSHGLHHLFGLLDDYWMRVAIIAGLMTVSTLSALSGLGRGIRILSLANLVLCVGLLLFVLISGPTSSLGPQFGHAMKGYATHFFQMSFDAGGGKGDAWSREWIFFFWAWWISWAPFVGSFIARISRGRTIRSILIGAVGLPSLFAVVWFTVLGGTALQRQRAGMNELAQVAGDSKSGAMFDVINSLPAPGITTVVVIVILGLLFITSADSASFALGSTTFGGSQAPPKPLRLMWSFGAAFAAVLLLKGGTQDLRAAAVIAAIPFTVILVGLCVSLAKALITRDKEEGGDSVDSRVGTPGS